MAWPPSTYDVISCNHSNCLSLILSQNVREGWTNSYWKRQVLTFYPLGKTNSGKPYGGGGGWELALPPFTSEGWFSWRGIFSDMDWYFQMYTTLERKEKLKQELDVGYCTLHRSLKVTAIYHQNHQYKTSAKLSKLVFPREFWSDLGAVGIVFPNWRRLLS